MLIFLILEETSLQFYLVINQTKQKRPSENDKNIKMPKSYSIMSFKISILILNTSSYFIW